MSRPLAGMKVLDFTHMLSGPLTTNFLCQLGAEVIKVETIGRGDHMRYYGPDRRYDGMSPSFIGVNAGKRSLAIDLKSTEGRDIILRLARHCDVVVENFRPGVADRLGFGYQAMQALRPDIVYCSISAYGQTGSRRLHAGVDNIVQATSGMMTVSGGPDDPPIRVGVPVIDMYSGTVAALAILAALVRRGREGRGEYIDTSMFDASLVLQTGLVVPTMVLGKPQPRTGNTGYSALPTAGVFKTRDGRQISLGVVQQNQFEALCRALERPDLLADPRFGQLKERNKPENHEPLRTILQGIFLMQDAEALDRRLTDGGVPAGVIREVIDVVRDPFLDECGIAVPLKIAGLPEETVRTLGTPFKLSEDGPGIDAPPPWLGEQSADILREIGFSADEIAGLVERRIIDTRQQGRGSAT